MVFNKNNEKRENIIFSISDVRTPQTPLPPPRPVLSGFSEPPLGGWPDVLYECPLRKIVTSVKLMTPDY